MTLKLVHHAKRILDLGAKLVLILVDMLDLALDMLDLALDECANGQFMGYLGANALCVQNIFLEGKGCLFNSSSQLLKPSSMEFALRFNGNSLGMEDIDWFICHLCTFNFGKCIPGTVLFMNFCFVTIFCMAKRNLLDMMLQIFVHMLDLGADLEILHGQMDFERAFVGFVGSDLWNVAHVTLGTQDELSKDSLCKGVMTDTLEVDIKLWKVHIFGITQLDSKGKLKVSNMELEVVKCSLVLELQLTLQSKGESTHLWIGHLGFTLQSKGSHWLCFQNWVHCVHLFLFATEDEKKAKAVAK